MSGGTVTLSERDVRCLASFGYSATMDPSVPSPCSPFCGCSGKTDTTTTATTGRNDAASWFADGIRKLAHMRMLGKNWESSGSLPPNELALALATAALTDLSDIDLQPDHVDPSTDEGVCISFGAAGGMPTSNASTPVNCMRSLPKVEKIRSSGRCPPIESVRR